MSTSLACPQCGSAVNTADGSPANHCPQCGTALSATTAPMAPMSSIPPPPVLSTAMPMANTGVVLQYGELQHAATYLGMARALRGIGIGNIVWGFILIIIAIVLSPAVQHSTGTNAKVLLVMSILYGVFAIIFIAEGIWLTASPSAAGLMTAAITMFVSAGLFVRGIVLLLALVFYGVALIKRHKKYGPLLAQRPAPEMLAQAKVLLDKLEKAKRKKAPELIEFSSSDAFARRLWRGLLQDNLIVLIALESRIIGRSIADVYFLPPSGLMIDIARKEFIGKWLKGTMYINDLKMNGTIPPECYERYQAWKAQATSLIVPPQA